MVHYGPSENQKFAIKIKPENYDLIAFMNFGHDDRISAGEFDGKFYTYTISRALEQNVRNRKIETADQIKLPWNKLNPVDRKIAYVSV